MNGYFVALAYYVNFGLFWLQLVMSEYKNIYLLLIFLEQRCQVLPCLRHESLNISIEQRLIIHLASAIKQKKIDSIKSKFTNVDMDFQFAIFVPI